jgi:hypothetical protein
VRQLHYTGAQGRLSEEVTSEWGLQDKVSRNSSGRWSNKCKGPGVAESLVCPGTAGSSEVKAQQTEQVEGTEEEMGKRAG